MKAAFEAGILPIVCVGETLQHRESNEAFAVVERQVKKGMEGLTPDQSKKVVIAYEPVWAIGTGKNATPQQAQDVHCFIRGWVAAKFGKEMADRLRIQYGGSVKVENAASLLTQPDIDGALIGGASLSAGSFLAIVKY